MNDINKLKQILDNAPEGATHYVNNEYCYRKETEEDFYLWANERWVLSSQVYFYTNSLSDLRTIVEQAERIADMQNQLDANARLLEFYVNEYQAKGGDV